MKELVKATKYLEDYDVTVKCFLTKEEVQNIINKMAGYTQYTDRIMVRDLLLLAYCTDIPNDKIDEIGYDAFVESGLMAVVRYWVRNIREIGKGIQWSESVSTIVSNALKSDEVKAKLGEVIKLANSKKR